MEPDQAAELGQVLRTRRQALGLSTRQLSALSGVNDITIVRIELGRFAAPRADKLAKLADALGLRLADIFALAEYVAPSQLPTLQPYLRSKYRDLPPEALADIERYATRLAKRHGVALEGPIDGEDELPETRSRTKKKGGTHARSNSSGTNKRKR
jgi:transcriptional regulator with XRE-family HTH domain